MARAVLVYQDDSGRTLAAEVIADGLMITTSVDAPIRFDLTAYAVGGYTVMDKTPQAIAQQLALEAQQRALEGGK